ncbi:conserved hypothetical protein, partial [Ricinus communis]
MAAPAARGHCPAAGHGASGRPRTAPAASASNAANATYVAGGVHANERAIERASERATDRPHHPHHHSACARRPRPCSRHLRPARHGAGHHTAAHRHDHGAGRAAAHPGHAQAVQVPEGTHGGRARHQPQDPVQPAQGLCGRQKGRDGRRARLTPKLAGTLLAALLAPSLQPRTSPWTPLLPAPTADDGVAALQALELPAQDIQRYSDREMLAQIDEDLRQASPVAAVGQELNLVKAHQALAERGYHWLVVRVDNDEAARTAADALKAAGAERAQLYGRFIIEELIEHAADLPQVSESPDRGLDAQTPSGHEAERAELRPASDQDTAPAKP